MRAVLVALALTLALEAGATSFPTPGPGHAPWVAVLGGGGGGGCTDGSTCYCDTASPTSLLVCEDFESRNYYEDTSSDFAAGVSGDGGLHDRGGASEWVSTHEFGSVSTSSAFRFSVEPTSPYIGSRCQFGSGAPLPGSNYNSCTGVIEYCSAAQGALTGAGVADCWGPGANANANLDIQRSGDFNAELGTLTLSGGTGSTVDVGAGNQHMAWRVPARNGDETGVGRRTFSSSSEIGVTMLHAYSSNVLSTGILNQPWKHEEWFNSSNGPGYGEHWMLGMTGATNDLAYFPFQPFMWSSSASACATALASATAHVGSVHCSDVGLGYTARGDAYPQFNTHNGTAFKNSGVTAYSRASNWSNLATWQCVRAHVTGTNGTMELKIWHNNTLVIHFSGLSTAGWKVNQTYNRMWWNAYSNEQNSNGLSATTYRYRDNVDIRNGPPVSCAAVGL